jgi:hypothetical protein
MQLVQHRSDKCLKSLLIRRLDLNSSQPTTTIKRPNAISQNKTFEMAKALERANLYLIILASVLFLNVLASALLFLRGNATEAASAPAAMPQWDKDEILGKLTSIEKDLSKTKFELAQQKAIVTRMQSVSDALQVAVSRIPPPNEAPHSATPQVQPPPVEQR